ncbi:Ger(x)C family spore germination protein [Clostridium hydrogenum]|uniref:Ger(x)C family spore germination protein n=1 Tax=Clostridium hydrogenum TaxID=2855764 RepID=UPI001F28A53B|nr:Ger(x)C family spore germination protein [Clostridium hydrogenum]
MYKRILSILLCLILLVTFTGCIESSETDDNVYAISIGLDKGNNNKVIVTIQYPTYRDGGGVSGTNSSANSSLGANVHSIESPSVLQSVNLFNMAISRKVSLKHVKMLVISEELARKGIAQYVVPLARFRELRRSMSVIITKNKAVDFIKDNKANIGNSVTKTIELMEVQSKTTGFFPVTKLHEFYKELSMSYGQAYAAYTGINDLTKLKFNKANNDGSQLMINENYLPGELPRSGIAKREFVGTAVFDGDKMVGALNPWETRCLLMITNKFNKGVFTIDDKLSPENAIAIELKLARKTKIKASFKDDKPNVDVDLYLEGDIGGIQSRISYERLDLMQNLNHQIEVYIKKLMDKTIEKTQKDFKSDVFQFGEEFVTYFPTIQKWEDYNWLKHYPEAKVNVNVKVEIRRTGLRTGRFHIFSDNGKD